MGTSNTAPKHLLAPDLAFIPTTFKDTIIILVNSLQTAMTYTLTSIFDIPHITDLITYYLDPPDIASCVSVSRNFNANFKPALWRKVRIDNSKINALVPRLDFTSGLGMMMNLRWTKRMILEADCRKGILPVLPWACRNLRDLATCINDHQSLQAVLDLVVTNHSQLKSWTICYSDNLSTPALRQLSRAISHSFNLTVLELSLRFRPRPGWLGHLLKNLPQSLARLNVVWADDPGDDERDRTISFPVQDWSTETRYSRLKSVEFGIELLTGEEHILVQFLERCPVLQRLDFPSMKTSQLNPLISSLGRTTQTLAKLTSLYLGWTNVVTEPQWRNLIQAMRGRIEHFSVDTDFRTPSTYFVPAMVMYWSGTLQSLQFLYLSPIYNRDVQLILTTCAGLKTFECTSVADQEALVTVQDSNNNHDTDVPGLTYADWVCLELEQLQLVFLNILRPGEPQAAGRINNLYRQIGRLTKLRELSIGWSATEGLTADAHLDMSLESGLQSMQGLKAMELLDVARIRRINVGSDEATWMLDNWPMLKTIRGLRYRADGLELDWFRQSNSERTDLTIE